MTTFARDGSGGYDVGPSSLGCRGPQSVGDGFGAGAGTGDSVTVSSGATAVATATRGGLVQPTVAGEEIAAPEDDVTDVTDVLGRLAVVLHMSSKRALAGKVLGAFGTREHAGWHAAD